MTQHRHVSRPERTDALTDIMTYIRRPAILIVDDEPSIVELLGQLVEDVGYRALRARNGRIALAIARRERPSLVLTDCDMPEMSGVEFVRRLRANPTTRGIPVVIMSSVRPALEGEAIPFLEKPFDLDDIVEKVTRYARPSLECG
jgi:CheY-like chemotaxis protein